MQTWAEWCAGGSRIDVEIGGVARQIFRRIDGDGAWLTLLHGWPTSSFDWAHVAPQLATRRKLLAFDFLGFGDSDKPTAIRMARRTP
jgi:pimeloyl-ACP methyl ester carboxylesterase